MNKTPNNINILIGKYISENASSEEKEQLEEWMAVSSENLKMVQKSKKAWKKGQYLISAKEIEQDKSNVHHKIQERNANRLRKTRKQLLIYKIAAILAIPVGVALSWYFFQGGEQTASKNLFCEITAPKGHVAKCRLPDGSEVWVNTGSTISYNTASFNQQTREVQLSGEAYFEVSKNKEKPFHVLSPMADINVTGTSFNVKAYPGSNAFEAVLVEGSIEMQLNNNTHQTVHLIPGEKALYNVNEKGISIEKVDPEMFSSWRKGEILFKDATLNDLIAELERIYDIKFHLKDPRLGEYRFRGMFSYNNNLIDALEKIKRTANINYYIENKEVWLSNK